MTTFDRSPIAPTSNYGIATEFLGVRPLSGASNMPQPDYARAFQAWENAIGAENVRRDDATRTNYSKTTLPSGTNPAGVVRPGTREEVRQIVQIANRCAVPIHAISLGKNWGYGDACAATDGQVIVELVRMDRIHEVNVELGYAVVEPGVSQIQMYKYLRDNDLPLLLDVTGAGPDASIVGNILQRGFGHTPYGDRFRHTCGFEVVLPDGRLVNTGFGQFENAKASRVYPWGVGPWVDGLFTQSNYGIVTSVCFWLMPMPECIKAFAFKVSNDKFGEVVEVIRRLRLAQTIRSTVHIANDLRVLSSRIGYPWERTGGATPLSDNVRQELRGEHGLGDWNGIGGLYGTSTEVNAASRVIAQKFRGIAKTFFFKRRTLMQAQKLGRYLQKLGWARRLLSTAESAESVLDLLEGVPTNSHLNGSFWRDRQENGKGTRDPRHSGLIWCSPVLPATRSNAIELLGLMNPIFSEYGFDPLLTMSSINERSLCCVSSINYDKQDPADAARAAQCYETLTSALVSTGYLPYRTASVTADHTTQA